MSKTIDQLELEYKEAASRYRLATADMARLREEIAAAKLLEFPLAGHKVSFERQKGWGKNATTETVSFLVEKVGFNIEGRTFKKDGTLGTRVTRYYPVSRANLAEGLTDHGPYVEPQE
jgi:hypothetical protein